MTLTYCDLCRVIVDDKDIISLETSNDKNNGLSLKICRKCELKMETKSEKNHLMILLEGEIR